MRRPGALAALAMLLLAGCLGANEEPAAPGGLSREDVLLPPWYRETPPPEEGLVDAPVLEAGRAWTYRADGLWDLTGEVTVVVAEARPSGYLFAAATPDDLRGEVFLERAWFGERDRELNRLPTDVHPEGWALFDFPLYDGKTWRRGEQVVTARAAEVAVPGGTEPGFEMTLGDGTFEVRYAYAPSVGFLTRYQYTWQDRVLFDLSLGSVDTTDRWVWYQLGSVVELAGAGPLYDEVVEVPRDADGVVVYAGGTPGAAGAVVPPPGSSGPWQFAVDGEDQAFTSVVLSASEGPWTLAAREPLDGFVYLVLVTTQWVRGATGVA